MTKSNQISAQKLANLGLLVLRISIGVIFISTGWLKLKDVGMFAESLSNFGFPLPTLWAYLVALIEFLGGLAVLVGFYSRVVAKLLAFIMLMALIAVHAPAASSIQEIFLPLALLGSTVALLTVGGGDWVLFKKDCSCRLCCTK